jgi:hypothetical protein
MQEIALAVSSSPYFRLRSVIEHLEAKMHKNDVASTIREMDALNSPQHMEKSVSLAWIDKKQPITSDELIQIERRYIAARQSFVEGVLAE